MSLTHISNSVIIATLSAVGTAAAHGVDIHVSSNDVDKSEVAAAVDAISKIPPSSFFSSDLADVISHLFVDGDAISIDDIAANDSTDIGAVSCYSNCYSNCYAACFGARGWR